MRKAYKEGLGKQHKEGLGKEYKEGLGKAYKEGLGKQHKEGLGKQHKEGLGKAYKEGYGNSFKEGLGKAFKELEIKLKEEKVSVLNYIQKEENSFLEHTGKSFFPGLLDYMVSGPVVPMVWRGKNIITISR